MSGQNDEVRTEAGTCGPGCSCNCGTQAGRGKKVKWLVFGTVMLAACVVVAARASGPKAEAPKQTGFALPEVSVSAAAPAAAAEPAGWVSLKKGLAELNVVATNTEAVFVVIPSDDASRTATIQKEVSAAVATIEERGTETGMFVLAKEAEDYKAVAQQLGAPSVLAMVKGRGMGAVADKEISKDALLKAFVSASRPRSGCGAGGCGPRGCK